MTTSLEAGRKSYGRRASLGASYPQIVTVLENAKRQRNLAGDLVVDAVPVTNRVYLEAVLGKDTTAKRDDSLKRTSTESSRPGRRWLLGLFGRERDAPAKNTATNDSSKDASIKSKSRSASSGTGSSNSTDQTDRPSKAASGDAKKGVDSESEPTAKKDASVQKATGDESPPPRRRLFDLFRRDDE